MLFESSNAALWAEDLALEEEIPVEVISAPAESDAKCGVALRVAEPHLAALRRVIEAEGLGYRVWEPGN